MRHSKLSNFLCAQLAHKPKTLTHVEAASVPYAALTAWSALTLTAGLLTTSNTRGKRVLVLGASGGVGHLALQLLRAWECEVDFFKKADILFAWNNLI